LYDAFGQGYTLMRFDASVSVRSLLAAASDARMPLTLLDIEGAEVPDAYRHKLVLCRDDQHVAWRSDVAPPDATALVATLCGGVPRST
jgi:hypothetical protein